VAGGERSARFHQEVSLDADTFDQAISRLRSDKDVEREVLQGEVASRVRRAIATLPLIPRDRKICKRLFLADWTLQEVADDLGISRQRAGQIRLKLLKRIQDALKKLRRVDRLEGAAEI
jgi:RNA polymerase sigma factor (sigma-70 family)